MDRKIEKKASPVFSRIFFGLILVIFVYFVFTLLWDANKGLAYSVEKSRLDISTVSSGIFEDFIPVRARVQPMNTFYLDAIEGGLVEKRLVDDGVLVSEGQLILQLSNTSLQLTIMRNEAEVTQQLNNLRTIELELERNRLSHKRNMIEINYQIKRLNRIVKRRKKLSISNSLSRSEIEDAEDELEYFVKLKATTIESQAVDSRLQKDQLKFLRISSKRLEDNLNFAHQILEKLNVRAPISGQISGLNVEVGQSIERGGRLGQIDDPDSFKFSAMIDEFYLDRVTLGQIVNFTQNNKMYSLKISKIYPQVKNGQFEVDMFFTEEQPKGIRRGQTIQTKLILDGGASAILISNGAFYQETGGNWAFVINDDGTQAMKRKLQLGRRNSRFIEVLDGLNVGEKIIISSYDNYKNVERLKLESI